MNPSENMEIQIDPREKHRALPDAPGHWWYEWTGSVLLVCRDSATQRLFFPAGEWAPERMWITDALGEKPKSLNWRPCYVVLEGESCLVRGMPGELMLGGTRISWLERDTFP